MRGRYRLALSVCGIDITSVISFTALIERQLLHLSRLTNITTCCQLRSTLMSDLQEFHVDPVAPSRRVQKRQVELLVRSTVGLIAVVSRPQLCSGILTSQPLTLPIVCDD